MIDIKTLDELARRLAATMPQELQGFQKDIEKNLRAGLASVFQKLDLVTREEYEVQVALLKRSREKLAALEERLAQIEQESGLTRSPPSTD